MKKIPIPPPHLQVPPGFGKIVARVISDLLNPAVVGIFITGVLAARIVHPLPRAMVWFSATVLITTLPPVGYIVYLVKTGYLSDFHMPQREKRVRPVSAIFIWLAFSVLILLAIRAPAGMVFLAASAVVEVALLGAVTFRWKISFHSATIMAAAIATLFLRSKLAWGVWPLVFVIGWARLRLRRHTPMQVLAGYLAGALVAAGAFYVLQLYFVV